MKKDKLTQLKAEYDRMAPHAATCATAMWRQPTTPPLPERIVKVLGKW